jgi:signal transduction histidine kinase
VGTIFAVCTDVLLVLAGVAVADVSVFWIGLVPVTVTGFYFGWLPSLFAGLGIALGMLILQYAVSPATELSLPSLLLGLTALPAAGPLAALLSSDEAEMVAMRERMRDRGRRADQVTRLAQEYMRVVVDLAAVLSISRLDPQRVLTSALNLSMESLERIGVPGPIYVMILLFAHHESAPSGTVLRVTRYSISVPPSDAEIVLPATSGAIDRALRTSEPVLAHAPDGDPELALFESFRASRTTLCLPLRSGQGLYGVMLVGSGQEDAFRETHVELMQAVANQAAASLSNVRLYAALLEERDRIVQIERDARAQLAAELHDGPTQGVAAITMRLNYIRKLIEKKPETAVDELYAIEDMARRTTKEIRHMLFELRPKALDQGLHSGLEQLAAKMKETYDQNVELRVQDGLDNLLDTQTVQTLFSICVEAMNNARKHAKASLITVDAGVQGDTLVLRIADNGVGFDVDRAFADAKEREGHLGLVNLHERAALVEGELAIQSAPGQGTRLVVTIPLEVLRLHREEEVARSAEGEQTRMVVRAADGK